MSTTGSRPAFPHANPSYDGNWDDRRQIEGMNLRDWFATHAPISMDQAWSVWTDRNKRTMADTLAASSERGLFLRWFAGLRYEYADAMLQEAAGED